MDFHFKDYANFRERSDAIMHIFPLGTARDYVSAVMGGSDANRINLNVGGRNDMDAYGYAWEGYPGGSVAYVFVFDRNDKLIRIACSFDEKCMITKGE
jgi:hypothetical protein